MATIKERAQQFFKKNPEEAERPSENYLIERKPRGIHVDYYQEGNLIARFFQTKEGVWFILTDASSPFDEDATLDPQTRMAQHLSEIIQEIN